MTDKIVGEKYKIEENGKIYIGEIIAYNDITKLYKVKWDDGQLTLEDKIDKIVSQNKE